MRARVLFAVLVLASCGRTILIPGPQGPAGPSGGNCTVAVVLANTVAPNGGALISCPDGTQSLILNGTNGTTITPVQLCSGPASMYPTNFPEIAFCINSSLYAVYSSLGGFLTEVPPGQYSSNGVGTSCIFTVFPNCMVTQ